MLTLRFPQGFCLVLSLLVAGSQVANADDSAQGTFLTSEAGGADFAVQGEYTGTVSEAEMGVQIIALGGGEFDGVVYPGGLPGAGWEPNAGKTTLHGKTDSEMTVLEGEHFRAVISGEVLTLTHSGQTGELKRVQRESDTLGAKPPAGAIVLFDGSSIDAWNAGKLEDDHLMGVGTRTKEKFSSYKLHLEFRTPFMPTARGQGRGNSGVYIGDQYELQVLDSFGLDGADNECGGVYQNARPTVNMCLPPLSWQTYDIDFTVAQFDDAGNVIAPGRATIRHNGVVVHKDLELKPTPGGGQNDQRPGALYLQDHGNPVRYRNIWLLPTK